MRANCLFQCQGFYPDPLGKKNVTSFKYMNKKSSVCIYCYSGRCLDKEPSITLTVGNKIYLIQVPDNLLGNYERNKIWTNNLAATTTTRLCPYSMGITSFFNEISKEIERGIVKNFTSNVSIIGPSQLTKMPKMLDSSYDMM